MNPANPEAQEVFDLVEEHLATMNADVAQNAAATINEITPPAQEGNRLFFRIASDFSLDSDGDGFLHVGSEMEKAAIINPGNETPFDINVYVVQAGLIHGTSRRNGVFRAAAGQTDREERRVWLGGRQTFPATSVATSVRTCAHEIGHVLIGNGHPDQEGGPARLPGTGFKKRLMVSGAAGSGVKASKRDKLLVKQEWDAIAETAKAISPNKPLLFRRSSKTLQQTPTLPEPTRKIIRSPF